MGAGGHDINKAIEDCIGSPGFWHSIPCDMHNVLSSTGDVPTTASPNAATTPLRVLGTGTVKYRLATGVTTFYLAFQLPIETADQMPGVNADQPFAALSVGFKFASAGTTDTPSITVTATAEPESGANKAGFTAVYRPPLDGTTPTTAAVVNDATGRVYVFDFTDVLGSASAKFARGDWVVVKVVLGTHGTDAIDLLSVFARAKLDAGRNAIQTATGVGNH